jgi:hypothetical protein
MVVNSEFHAPVTLTPRKGHLVPNGQEDHGKVTNPFLISEKEPQILNGTAYSLITIATEFPGFLCIVDHYYILPITFSFFCYH